MRAKLEKVGPIALPPEDFPLRSNARPDFIRAFERSGKSSGESAIGHTLSSLARIPPPGVAGGLGASRASFEPV